MYPKLKVVQGRVPGLYVLEPTPLDPLTFRPPRIRQWVERGPPWGGTDSITVRYDNPRRPVLLKGGVVDQRKTETPRQPGRTSYRGCMGEDTPVPLPKPPVFHW